MVNRGLYGYEDLFDDLIGLTYEGTMRGRDHESEIAALVGENERLRVERDEYRRLFHSYARKYSALAAKMERGSKDV